MRRWFLVFLIVLLPLRVLAADAMAVQMLGQPFTKAPDKALNKASDATVSIAASADNKRAIATFDVKTQSLQSTASPAATSDCHGNMAATPMPPATVDANAVLTDCGSCAACALCHLSALPVLAVFADPSPLAQAPRVATITRFFSAERAPGFKPPIS